MEPRREEQNKAPPGADQKPKRFRIIKLEERIAPGNNKNSNNGCYNRPSLYCSGTCGGGCYRY
jgi:hypothetical protein